MHPGALPPRLISSDRVNRISRQRFPNLCYPSL